MTQKQEEYQEYLKTDYWKEVSLLVKTRDEFRCRVCNSAKLLEVHHRCYRHKGEEKDHLNDLTTLCKKCHSLYHRKAPKPQSSPATPPPVQISTTPDVLVTHTNFHRLRSGKEMWHWYRGIGVNPRRRSWMKRMIGRSVPAYFLR